MASIRFLNFIAVLVTKGDSVPPYPAWRIVVILRKKKALDLEKEFLEVWVDRFHKYGLGQVFIDLCNRFEKLKGS